MGSETKQYRHQKVAVVGGGKTGLGLVEFFNTFDAKPYLIDDKAVQAPAEVKWGTQALKNYEGADLVVLSPGVPVPDFADQLGIPVLSEIELAQRHLKGTMVGITGTNGKSTVTTCVGEMAKKKFHTFVGGNLGEPLIQAVLEEHRTQKPFDVIVAELSSFQLERIEHFHTDIGVILNVTADHLDRHKTMKAYTQAKANIWKNQSSADVAIFHEQDRSVMTQHCPHSQQFTFGTSDIRLGDCAVANHAILSKHTGYRFALNDLQLIGTHNQDNISAAILCAESLEITSSQITETLRAFKGLPHRTVLVGTVKGVRYIDDSKATNVGATVAALRGLSSAGKVVLLLGGVDKGGSYQPIFESLETKGRGIVAYGQAANIIEQELKRYNATAVNPILYQVINKDFASVIETASRMAMEGDDVLLAPACSSFDMFTSYAHRGDVFAQEVFNMNEKKGPHC